MSIYHCHNKPPFKNKWYSFKSGWILKKCGYVPDVLGFKTKFDEIGCCHITSAGDKNCDGCKHQREEVEL